MKHPIILTLILSLLCPLFAEEETDDKQHYIIVKEYKCAPLIIPGVALSIWAAVRFSEAYDYSQKMRTVNKSSNEHKNYKSKQSFHFQSGLKISLCSLFIITAAIVPIETKVPVQFTATLTSINLTYNF